MDCSLETVRRWTNKGEHNESSAMWSHCSHILRAWALLVPSSPPFPPLVQCMELTFKTWRGSLGEGGGTRRDSGAPLGGGAAPSQPFGTMNKEKKYTILSKRDGECVFSRPKCKVGALMHFLAASLAGLVAKRR